jgi:hypothetical protein
MRDVAEVENPSMNDTWVGGRLDVFLPAAAKWILIAGEKLWGKVNEGGEGRWEKELSRERWEGWRERFRGFTTRSDLEARSRIIAKMVVDQMAVIESKND